MTDWAIGLAELQDLRTTPSGRVQILQSFGPAVIIIPKNSVGTVAAPAVHMNPQAEALKDRSFRFALHIVRFCRSLRTTWEGRQFSDQLFRSGTRVGANYRAACRARSHADFVSKIGIVVEESDEAIYWLDLIAAAGLSTGAQLEWLRREAAELSRIFNASQLTARMNAASKRR